MDAPLELLCDSSLPSSARLLACALWWHVRPKKQRFCWASTRRLASMLGQTERATRAQLRRLADRGWIGRSTCAVSGYGRRFGWTLNEHPDPAPADEPEDEKQVPLRWPDCSVPPEPPFRPPGTVVPPPRNHRSAEASMKQPIEAVVKAQNPVELRVIRNDDDQFHSMESANKAHGPPRRSDVREEADEHRTAEPSASLHYRVCDEVRREVEQRTQIKIGPLRCDAASVSNIAVAVGDDGIGRVCEVVRHTAELAARGAIAGALWRGMFAGSGGYYARRDACEQHEQRQALRAAAAARRHTERAERHHADAARMPADRMREILASGVHPWLR